MSADDVMEGRRATMPPLAMGQVAVTLNGRTYRLQCGDGEEERLLALAAHVRDRLETLTAEFGQAGDERLLLMAALLTADELLEARDRIAELERDFEMVTAPNSDKATGKAKTENGASDKVGTA